MIMKQTKETLIVIGNGMAGGRFLSELLERDSARYKIIVFGAESHGNYNRIMLSPVLSGEKKLDEIMINSIDWYEENNIQLRTNSWVTAINSESKQIEVNHDEKIDYDKLVIATGSNPFIIPVKGNDLEGVVSFRDIKDVDFMLAAARKHRRAVVIGGGLLGLEAANGLKIQGMDVTVVHRSTCLMDRQLDSVAGQMLIDSLSARGIKFKMGANTSAFISHGSNAKNVGAVQFSDGSEISADLVVMTAGIRPNISLAKSSGINCEAGIVVDDHMQTSEKDIYAIGECVQHRKVCYGLVAPLYEMAKACAALLCEDLSEAYVGTITSTKLKVTGIDVFSVGDFQGNDQSESITMIDPANRIYRKLVIQNNVLIGAVLFGNTSLNAEYMDLIIASTDISTIRSDLMFGPVNIEMPTEEKQTAA